MTSLLPPSTRLGRSEPVAAPPRRPSLAVIAALAGAAAAGAVLLVCLALGVVGWFLSDAGAHGTPRDGMRVGALGWLAAHGSGIAVDGFTVTTVPLGLTLLCVWSVWRIARRLGELVSGHGPDADRIGDGERDWTVPTAVGLFALGYVVVAVLTVNLAATPATSPDTARVVGWTLALSVLVAGPAVAVGSGRAAVWTALLPPGVRVAADTARRVLLGWLAVSAAVLLAALVLDLGTALNIMSQLGAGAGGATLLTLAGVAAVPNAVLFSGSYLLGPGFLVGAGTVVSPSAVVLGPLPMFPLLAALPDTGTPPMWLGGVLLLAPLTAGVAASRAQLARVTVRYEEAALRGCAGGVVAGIVVGLLTSLAGGALGPGRMRMVGPAAGDVLVHAIVAFGVGGLLGGLATTWWARRQLVDPGDPAPAEESPTAEESPGAEQEPGGRLRGLTRVPRAVVVVAGGAVAGALRRAARPLRRRTRR